MGLGARDEGQGHGRDVLDALMACMVRGPRRHRAHLAEAGAQDVDVVDGVLDEAAAAGLHDVGPPPGRVGPPDREVLVVAEHGRHGGAQRPTPDEVAQRPEDRRAAQHEAALAGHTGGGHRVDECGGPGQVPIERLLAEQGAAGGQRLVHGAPVRRRRRADPDGVAAGRHLAGTADDGRGAGTQAVGEGLGPPRALVVDGHDRRVDDAAVDHRLEAETVRPGDEARSDEADAQHAPDTRRPVRRGQMV